MSARWRFLYVLILAGVVLLLYVLGVEPHEPAEPVRTPRTPTPFGIEEPLVAEVDPGPTLEGAKPIRPRQEDPIPRGWVEVRSITGPDGKPVSEARVAWTDEFGSWASGESEVEPDQLPLRLDGLAVGKLGVQGPDGTHWIGPIPVPMERRAYPMHVKLHAGLSIRGVVLQQDGVTPATRASVYLEEVPLYAGESSVEDPSWIDVDAEGRFVIPGLTPGSYLVEASGDEPKQGSTVERRVKAGATDVLLVLGRQRTITVRIVDETGALLTSRGGVEGVFGLARVLAGEEGAFVAFRVHNNPITMTLNESLDAEFQPFHAFADGHTSSASYTPRRRGGPAHEAVDLVVRRIPKGVARVALAIERGRSSSTTIYLSRNLGRLGVGRARKVVAGRLELELPVGQSIRMVVNPMVGPQHFSSQRAFDPRGNGRLGVALEFEPAPGLVVPVRFPEAGGIRILGPGLGGTPLGLLRDGERTHRFHFWQGKRPDGTAGPISAPVPPGRWKLTLPQLAPSERRTAIVEVRAGEVTDVDIASLRKKR